MEINTTHPDYPEAEKRFRALCDACKKECETAKSKYPNWRGQDHPASEECKEIHRRLFQEMKKLQKEYAYLFVGDPETEPDERKRGKE